MVVAVTTSAPHDVEALAFIVQLARLPVGASTSEIEEWCSEYARYVSDAVYDQLERLLHDHACVPDGDCRCREPKEGPWEVTS